LAAPPARGQLQAQLQALADKKWRHPIGGHWFTLGLSTIERWYYKASAAKEGPVHVLQRKIRSYENPYVNGLWHLDFHHGSRRVLLPSGQWSVPLLLGILDDHSRLCCHAQWYLAEGAEDLCHGLSQAFQKRAIPRSLLEDNGSTMIAAETEQGLARLSIMAEHTLPYSPYQNGKQESFWGQIEGRLLPMLEGVADLSLDQLNEATLAWCEIEYNRKIHSETDQTPLERYLHDKDVGRPCPDTEQVRLAFTAEVTRTQRRSDGSFSLEGVRFEVPSRYAHFHKLAVRYASWDRSFVHLADPKTGVILCRLYPQDKNKNAEGRRAPRQPALPAVAPAPAGIAPLLQQILHQYATQIAGLLSFLRQLQRQFQVAVLLVHHARKDSDSSRPGQALRGSSELHGWGDSNLYLRRKGSQLTLSIEHRAAPSQDHIPLHLAQPGPALALARTTDAAADPPPESVAHRVRRVLADLKEPISVQRLRQLCGLRTATVCAALAQLSDQGLVCHDHRGYQLKLHFDDPLVSLSRPIGPLGKGNGKH
jgi:transposase InsO family protein